jgi:hypothetical protein
MMGRGLYGKLAPHMIVEADFVAQRRQDNADRYGYVHRNHLAAGAGDLPRHILGARTERAAKIIFEPIVWNKGLDGAGDMPDLGDFIDVKGVTSDDHCLLVWQGGVKPQWAYLLVSAEQHPYYWMAGWLWGHEVERPENLEQSFGPYVHRPAYRIAAARLHPTYLLQRVVRDRNGGSS